MRKRVMMLTTGGTIASVETEGGLAPGMSGGDLVGGLGALWPSLEIETCELMSIDSSNMQPEQWQTIARAIYDVLDRCDGVIVTHGTDTMAYTAAALAYMLRGLDMPVVLTGSQRPFGSPMSDAAQNIDLAAAAVDAGIRGVSVAFGGRVIAGTRASKTSSMDMTAFESVGAPLLAELKADGLRVCDAGRRDAGPRRLMDGICPDVAAVRATPGLRPEHLRALVSSGLRGLVIEAYGAGGVSFMGRDISSAIGEICAGGTAVAVTSQCPRERVDMTLYEVGRRLMDAGAIACGDMTAEAATVKLMWCLGSGLDPSECFKISYAGEITI